MGDKERLKIIIASKLQQMQFWNIGKFKWIWSVGSFLEIFKFQKNGRFQALNSTNAILKSRIFIEDIIPKSWINSESR